MQFWLAHRRTNSRHKNQKEITVRAEINSPEVYRCVPISRNNCNANESHEWERGSQLAPQQREKKTAKIRAIISWSIASTAAENTRDQIKG